jgi:ribosomal protein S18 acetylase RimI-like enzyme
MLNVQRPLVSVFLPEQDSEVALVLGRAFVNDPPLRAVLPHVIDPVERAHVLSQVFTLALKLQRRHRQPVLGILQEGRVVAAAVTEVARRISIRTMLLTGCGMLPRMLAAVGSGGTLRAIRLGEDIGKNRPHEPHLYLSLIGVDPEHQGRRYGIALLEHLYAMTTVRTDLIGIYLETATERNVAYYEHAGYQVLGEMRPLGVRMWRMMRPSLS